jgi:hypothetical protein
VTYQPITRRDARSASIPGTCETAALEGGGGVADFPRSFKATAASLRCDSLASARQNGRCSGARIYLHAELGSTQSDLSVNPPNPSHDVVSPEYSCDDLWVLG